MILFENRAEYRRGAGFQFVRIFIFFLLFHTVTDNAIFPVPPTFENVLKRFETLLRSRSRQRQRRRRWQIDSSKTTRLLTRSTPVRVRVPLTSHHSHAEKKHTNAWCAYRVFEKKNNSTRPYFSVIYIPTNIVQIIM